MIAVTPYAPSVLLMDNPPARVNSRTNSERWSVWFPPVRGAVAPVPLGQVSDRVVFERSSDFVGLIPDARRR